VDFVSAACSAVCVAPFVVCVDKAVAESAGGKAELWSSFFASIREMAMSPVTYIRQPAFRYLAVLFGGTYWAANSFMTFAESREEHSRVGKAATVFVANTSLSLWKDSALAKLFGTKVPTAVPRSALASWWARDAIGMSVIFVAPPIVAQYLHSEHGMNKQRAQVVSQVALPMMIQPVVAPFHMLGYVLYNQPGHSWSSHLEVVRREFWGTLCMRWIRVFPPFSMGTVVNTSLRESMRSGDHS